jgi:alanine racemase
MSCSAAGGGAPITTGARLTVDLAALCDNYRLFAKTANGAVCAGVVKADAYGLGLSPVAGALARTGCEVFFVALPGEAQILRAAVPAAEIYVLDGLLPGTAELLQRIDARPVLGSLQEIEDWARHSQSHGGGLKAALHIDTGMNRLGLSDHELGELLDNQKLLDAFSCSAIMTHLACADNPDHVLNQQQIARFKKLARRLPAAPLSAANSAGILNGPDYHFDLVRPGIGLYGGNPRPGLKSPLKPVVTLEAPVLQLRTVKPGESVGYGAAFTAGSIRKVAILALGYGDGLARALGAGGPRPGAQVYFDGLAAPLIGRVSMDLTAVDVTDIPEDKSRRGMLAEILGQHQSVDQLAHHAGTIGYEILTALGGRYERVYLDGETG